MDIQLEKKKGFQKKHIPYVAGGLEHSRLVYTYYNLIISKFQDKIIHFTVKILLCNHVLYADFLSIPVQSSSDTALLMGFHLI